MKSCVFFRNDDVRGTLDHSLVRLVEIFILNETPICLAVEPANVSADVVSWLIDLKDNHPSLINIVQHGLNHQLNIDRVLYSKRYKGEFGASMSYADQYEMIRTGIDLMDELFGDRWFRAFAYPFGGRNKDTVRVLHDLGFKIAFGNTSCDYKSRLFYSVGRCLGRETLFGRKISWHMRSRFSPSLLQVDFCISVITKYLNSDEDAVFMDLNQFAELIDRNKKCNQHIGILFHHRYHNSDTKLQLIHEYLQKVKSMADLNVIPISDLYRNV